MNLHNLPKTISKKNKRLGRGHGSGRVKTSGRGTKGQKARGKIRRNFEGGQLSLLKRLPFIRGKNRNKPLSPKPLVINVKFLNLLPPNTIVDKNSLIKFGLLKKDEADGSVKILGEGQLKTTLIIKLPCSHGAAKKITAAGGKIEK